MSETTAASEWVLKSSNHSAIILDKLNIMRENNIGTDLRLSNGEQEVSCHRVVFTAVSEFAKRTLYIDEPNSDAGTLQIDNMDIKSLEQFVEYVYTGQIKVNDENANNLVNIAEMFEVETLRVGCMAFMKRSRKVPANAADSENTSQKVSSPQKCTVEVLKKAGGGDEIQPSAMKKIAVTKLSSLTETRNTDESNCSTAKEDNTNKDSDDSEVEDGIPYGGDEDDDDDDWSPGKMKKITTGKRKRFGKSLVANLTSGPSRGTRSSTQVSGKNNIKETKQASEQCTICEKYISTADGLVRHMRVHTGEKPYSCNVCGQTFTVSSNLYKHCRTKHGKATPEMIGKRVRDKRKDVPACSLASNDVIVSNADDSDLFPKSEKIHTSPNEDENYANVAASRSLSPNKNTQSRTKQNESLQCEICDKTLYGSTGLKRHMRIHTGERPYSCNLCGQLFTTSSNVYKHCRTKHGEVKPEMIGKCSGKYVKKTKLEKYFTCNVCGSQFTTSSNVHKHCRTKHGEVKPEMISKPPRKPKKICERQEDDSLEYSNDELMSESSNDCEEESDSEFSDMFSCPLCEETCADLSKLKNHLKEEHSSESNNPMDKQKDLKPIIIQIGSGKFIVDEKSTTVTDEAGTGTVSLDDCNSTKVPHEEAETSIANVDKENSTTDTGRAEGTLTSTVDNENNTTVLNKDAATCTAAVDDENNTAAPDMEAETSIVVLHDENNTAVLDKEAETSITALDDENNIAVPDKEAETSIAVLDDENNTAVADKEAETSITALDDENNTAAPDMEAETSIAVLHDENNTAVADKEAETSINALDDENNTSVNDKLTGTDVTKDGLKSTEGGTEFNCPLCEFPCNNLLDFKLHVKQLHQSTQNSDQQTTRAFHKCNVCNEVFKTRRALKRHMMSHRNDKKFICKVCDERLVSNVALYFHCRRKHPKLKVRRQTVQIDCTKVLNCPLCKIPYTTRAGLNKHVREFHKEDSEALKLVDSLYIQPLEGLSHKIKKSGKMSYACSSCGKEFRAANTAKLHVRAVHLGERPHVCGKCGKSFGYPQTLKLHNQTVHENLRPFKCTVCSKAFVRETGLKDHMKSHTKEKSYLCHLCGKSFGYIQSFNAHKKIHSDEKPYECDMCGKRFKLKGTLTDHQNHVHKTGPTTECEVCKKVMNVNYLKKHMIAHSDYRPHECLTCGKTFKTERTLRNHESTHNTTRPFVCTICRVTFKAQYQLLKHKATHKLPFRCGHCKQGFKTEESLRKHLKTHARKFSCSKCQRTFDRQRGLFNHQKFCRFLPDADEVQPVVENATEVVDQIIYIQSDIDLTAEAVASLQEVVTTTHP
ncbi:uncharacterized protein LOC100367537 [Saccoglossus kowalevskii]|uniref:Mucin-22-like n=1 Tax=Saccoglossus kowalevskii TaxID=10224 RepID=A0ABM0MM02_SACKO|nr:PREDICTED: mucin-22-like [Saccoglossus kowalevskii]